MNYDTPRYWYHISTTLQGEEVCLTPRRDGINRSENEPYVSRICVAPTIPQCFVAVPYHIGDTFNVYRTKEMVVADPPHGVFDAKVTDEGWLTKRTTFVYTGSIDMGAVEAAMGEKYMRQVTFMGSEDVSQMALRWWKRVKIEKFLTNVPISI